MYRFEINKADLATLSAGPRDVDATIRILTIAATNPIVKMQIPVMSVMAAKEKIEHDMHNFQSSWAESLPAYKNQQEGLMEMRKHFEQLTLVYHLIDRLCCGCQCPSCRPLTLPYGPRMAMN